MNVCELYVLCHDYIKTGGSYVHFRIHHQKYHLAVLPPFIFMHTEIFLESLNLFTIFCTLDGERPK